MVTKILSTDKAYIATDKTAIGFNPLSGLKRIAHGFQDCLESFEDWQILMKCPRLSQQPRLKTFFNLLGQPLEGATEYWTPWDKFLDDEWCEQVLGGEL